MESEKGARSGGSGSENTVSLLVNSVASIPCPNHLAVFSRTLRAKLVNIKQVGQAYAQEFILELSPAPNGQG